MKRKNLDTPSPPASLPSLSRRELLAGAAALALVPSASAASLSPIRPKRSRPDYPRGIVRRHMAASVRLLDGRILVTGGYSSPLARGQTPAPLAAALLIDPATGEASPAASMAVPRARHAAVVLPDGRVAVLGGLGFNATASVEIYDPAADRWHAGGELAQPRYDHNAILDHGQVLVLGGMTQSLQGSIEVYKVLQSPVRRVRG